MNSDHSFSRWLSGALLCGATLVPVCYADTIFLNDGREVNGTIVNEDQQTIVIKTTRGQTRSIRRSEIDSVVREKAKVAGKDVKDEPPAVGVPPPASPTETLSGTRPITPGPNASVSTPNTAAPSVTDTPGKPNSRTPGARVAPATTNASATAPLQPAGPPVPTSVIPKPGTPSATAGRPDAETPPTREPAPASSKEAAASGESPIPGLPKDTQRMSKRKEALLADALDTIKVAYKNPEDTTRGPALADISALGKDVIPYLWAGVQNDNAEVRIACMKLIGQMGAKTCTKRVIETFYMTMPESSAAATWNVPFVDETMKTCISITGQTFITVEARRLGVQDGLKKYIDWYKTNCKTLPRQIGEPELDPNDKDYDSKLAALRELKLSKREWPNTGSLPTDYISGPNTNGPTRPTEPVIKDAERVDDKKFGDSVPTVSEDKALKRPTDQPGAPEDDEALKRPIDRRVGQNVNAPQNQRRDPPSEVPSQTTDLQKDPLLRPQDVLRQQQQNR